MNFVSNEIYNVSKFIMLTYKEIVREIKKRNFDLKEFIPECTGYTVDGFRISIEKKTLRVDALEKISQALKIPMSYWFKDEDKLIVTEAERNYGESLHEIIRRLNKLLDEAIDDKDRLKKQVDELQAKLGEFQSSRKRAG